MTTKQDGWIDENTATHRHEETKTCPECNGEKHGIYIDTKKRIKVVKICDECNGTGKVTIKI